MGLYAALNNEGLIVVKDRPDAKLGRIIAVIRPETIYSGQVKYRLFITNNAYYRLIPDFEPEIFDQEDYLEFHSTDIPEIDISVRGEEPNSHCGKQNKSLFETRIEAFVELKKFNQTEATLTTSIEFYGVSWPGIFPSVEYSTTWFEPSG
jgi:hypothetical protein